MSVVGFKSGPQYLVVGVGLLTAKQYIVFSEWIRA